jgi:N-acetylglutamate synthase-like GNAT family acetyltransferase
MATQELTNIIVRSAVEADIPRLIVFIRPFVEDRKLLPRTYEELNELLANFFVAELDGRIVGCAALEIYSWKLAEIRSLAVAPDTQGMGIGKKLVEACLDRAHAKRVLEVMAVTSSDRFFLNCGFDYTLPGEKRALFYQTRDL